jgi:hypothetical protein
MEEDKVPLSPDGSREHRDLIVTIDDVEHDGGRAVDVDRVAGLRIDEAERPREGRRRDQQRLGGTAESLIDERGKCPRGCGGNPVAMISKALIWNMR